MRLSKSATTSASKQAQFSLLNYYLMPATMTTNLQLSWNNYFRYKDIPLFNEDLSSVTMYTYLLFCKSPTPYGTVCPNIGFSF